MVTKHEITVAANMLRQGGIEAGMIDPHASTGGVKLPCHLRADSARCSGDQYTLATQVNVDSHEGEWNTTVP